MFSCLVRGGAPLQYHWLFNGKLLKTDEEHEIRESHLLVRHSQIAHSGVYTCRIRNDYGHVKHNIELKVLRKLYKGLNSYKILNGQKFQTPMIAQLIF